MAKLKWFEDPQVFRAKRKQLGLTQTQLSKVSNVDRGIIADIETGRRPLKGNGDVVSDALWGALMKITYQRRKQLQTPEERKAEKKRLERVYAEGVITRAKLLGLQSTTLRELAEKGRQQKADRERQLAALEKARGFNDPIRQEIEESFRREIEELGKLAELLRHELEEARTESN